MNVGDLVTWGLDSPQDQGRGFQVTSCHAGVKSLSISLHGSRTANLTTRIAGAYNEEFSLLR